MLSLLQTFKQWHESKVSARAKEQESTLAERKRKGIMTGKEIFAQASPTCRHPARRTQVCEPMLKANGTASHSSQLQLSVSA